MNFNNQSTNAASIYWDLGNGTNSTLDNPTVDYASALGNDTFYYPELKVSNWAGCRDSVKTVIKVYPGPLGIPQDLPANLPPAFLVVASDDGAAKNIVRLIDGYSSSRMPFEAHIYHRGGHGFNMGQRSKLKSVSTWPQRLADWLADNIVEAAPVKP